MKHIFALLFLAIFFVTTGLARQPDSVQILEMTGDSLLAAGDFEAASRAYFYAFYKQPDSRRLGEKFQFLDLEKKPNREQKKLFLAKYFRRKAALKFADFDYETAEVFYEYSLEFAPDSATEAAFEKLKTVRLLEQKAGEFAHKLLIDSAVHFYEKADRLHPNPYFTEQIAHLHRADSIIKSGLVGTKFVQIILSGIVALELSALSKKGLCFQTKDYFYLAFFPKEHFTTKDKAAAFFNENNLDLIKHEEDVFELRSFFLCGGFDFNNVNFEELRHRILLNEKNRNHLHDILDFMKDYPEVEIQLTGHAAVSPKDGKTPAEKLALSKRRGLEVMKYLVDRGIEPFRLRLKYFGGESPQVREQTAEDAKINRRVEFQLVHINDIEKDK